MSLVGWRTAFRGRIVPARWRLSFAASAVWARAYLGACSGLCLANTMSTSRMASTSVGLQRSHLEDAILDFADEAFWAPDRRGEGALKMLITEPVLPIEGKVGTSRSVGLPITTGSFARASTNVGSVSSTSMTRGLRTARTLPPLWRR